MEQEDYLETIYNLKKRKGHATISDVAVSLGVKTPSVTQMMQRLQKEGCVVYQPYAPLELTKKGEKIGRSVSNKHNVLGQFFTLIGVPKNIQEKDIHGIEHYLSPVTLKRLKEATTFLKTHKFSKGMLKNRISLRNSCNSSKNTETATKIYQKNI